MQFLVRLDVLARVLFCEKSANVPGPRLAVVAVSALHVSEGW